MFLGLFRVGGFLVGLLGLLRYFNLGLCCAGFSLVCFGFVF